MKFGLPGIEPGPYPPHEQILPLYYSPLKCVGAPRIELGPHAPKACILPIYYAPPFGRGAENRTRFSRTRIAYTTGVLRPEKLNYRSISDINQLIMTFKRTKENFICEHCGETVVGNGYTNHCPVCLWSKHVDIDPGDRAEACSGMMEPIDTRIKNKELGIRQRCIKCGFERWNRIEKGDNQELLTTPTQ